MDDHLPGAAHWGRRFFGELYRATTLEHLTPGRTRAEAAVLARLLAVRPGARLLDLGCGHGRHAIELARAGHRVVGLDLDEASLGLLGASAQSCGLRVPAVRADLGNLPIAPGCLDGAYAWYSSLLLFDDATHLELLGRVAAALRPGAALVHQSVDPAALAARPIEKVERPLRRGGRVVEESRFDAASGRDQGVRRAELPDGRVLSARFSIRYPTPGALASLLARAGFARVHLLDGPQVGLEPGLLLARAIR